ncbi:P-loop containing nucleoside triphosphate hydrolase protein [Basidiobolus meristosporus CBS 931.73]|uniref:p-loop containing nucleoside triphosphate hydrolase protein n=1 Tax=Basidiobolus meristosporus CBS 931.73 TaxID=1314790 RepID=A0A1Y1XT35_9FUNG|nr:P-loop containing nucleoside triphosphate hydrolase protein [Basidiobolus meristosporus CBS 931.73]|eukprot:ORX88666.1 P-loop containing nucleoside triphosphate hydrolase protein [Basidiobolus meristosporus CBS 931.73]
MILSDLPDEKGVTSKEKRYGYFDLYRYATGDDKALMLLGLMGASVSGVAAPLMTMVSGDLINLFSRYFAADSPVSTDHFKKDANALVLYFVCIGVVAFVCCYASRCTFAWTGDRIARRVREAYLKAVLRQEIAYFDQLGPGEVATRISRDTHLLHDGISIKVTMAFQVLSIIISGFVVAFIRDWKLSLALCCLIPLVLVTLTACAYYIEKMAQRESDLQSKAGTHAEEVIASARTFTTFGIQGRLADTFECFLQQIEAISKMKAVASAFSQSGVLLWILLVHCLALWYGGRLVVDKEIEVGTVNTVLVSVFLGALSLNGIAPTFQAFTKARGAGSKLYDVIDRVPPIDSASPEGKVLDSPVGHIQLCDVVFQYPARPTVEVLKGISLDVRPGTTVALVGSSGSGKSTIIELIERYHDTIGGQVLFDGHDIRQLNLRWLRRNISLVSQEPTLFSTTIWENVAYGLIGTESESLDKDAKMKLIVEACKMSNAHDFIMDLPLQYETLTGERGFLLSGGQKQRIAIARAVVKNPKVLLLDEATSALDTQAEGIVQDALNRIAQDRTTITIAHRLSTIRHATKIVVMDGGEIRESGNHAELMELNGIYAKLVEAQSVDTKCSTQLVSESKSAEEVVGDPPIDQNSTVMSALEAGSTKSHNTLELIIAIARANYQEIGYTITGSLSSIINGGINPVFAILFAHYVTDLSTSITDSDATNNKNHWTLLLLYVSVAAFIAQWLSTYSFLIASERLSTRLRSSCFRSILRQDIGWFDRKENTAGSLTSSLALDATLVQGLTGMTAGVLINFTTCIVVGIVIGFVFDWKLTLVALPFGYHEQIRESYEISCQIASESVRAIRTVASLTREDNVCHIYSEELEKPMAAGRKNALVGSLAYAFSQSIIYFSTALVFWYGGERIIDSGHINHLTSFIIVSEGVIFGAQSAGQIFAYFPDISRAKAAASNILNLLQRKPRIDTWSINGASPAKIEGYIHFENVHFGHYANQPVLRGLNFEARPGQYVALVGPSGSGKSTAISLVERFYDVQKGQILLDGRNIAELNINTLRRLISLVSQEPTLYNMSIRENIVIGVEGSVAQEKVEQVCRDANIHDFIMSLPDAYETNVGGGGAQLSGGQKQRISIARALIRDPKILLLDEATSALDSQSERSVQSALDKASHGRTTIAIAHRLSTIQHADLICVLKDGIIVEKGSHKELLGLQGTYYKMVQEQNMHGG